MGNWRELPGESPYRRRGMTHQLYRGDEPIPFVFKAEWKHFDWQAWGKSAVEATRDWHNTTSGTFLDQRGESYGGVPNMAGAGAKRKIELVGALINDIRDEDIQAEYLGAFTQIRSAVVNLIAKYTTDGFCEETEGLLALYKGLIQEFEEEYEL